MELHTASDKWTETVGFFIQNKRQLTTRWAIDIFQPEKETAVKLTDDHVMVKETADQTFEVLMSDLDPEAMKVFYSG